jgi:AcrR family transcriptional regulator
MARPVKYDTAQLLDAAAGLVVRGGPAAVTMAALAQAAGVPNGSVYHRFPGRSALLAELWLRSLESFQAGYVDALKDDDPYDAAAAAARFVVEWSRDNPDLTAVFAYSAEDFGKQDWPEQAVDRLTSGNRRAFRAVRALSKRLDATTKEDLERVTVAVLDIPYGIVRRHLRAGTRVPAYAADLAERSAIAVLKSRLKAD